MQGDIEDRLNAIYMMLNIAKTKLSSSQSEEIDKRFKQIFNFLDLMDYKDSTHLKLFQQEVDDILGNNSL